MSTGFNEYYPTGFFEDNPTGLYYGDSEDYDEESHSTTTGFFEEYDEESHLTTTDDCYACKTFTYNGDVCIVNLCVDCKNNSNDHSIIDRIINATQQPKQTQNIETECYICDRIWMTNNGVCPCSCTTKYWE